jgi:hypothetical protein
VLMLDAVGGGLKRGTFIRKVSCGSTISTLD